jgi:hypothetical protein
MEMPIRAMAASRRGSSLKNRKVWLSIAAVAILSLVVLGFLFRRFILSGLDLAAEAMGSRTIALITLGFALLALVFVIIWMLFPIFVYLGLRDLGRRAAELDVTARLLAAHVGHIVAHRAPPATPPAANLVAPEGTSSRQAEEIPKL